MNYGVNMRNFGRMIRQLENLLDDGDIIDIARSAMQPPEFALKICNEFKRPVQHLMAKFESDNFIQANNVDNLIEILKDIEADKALELVQQYKESLTECREEQQSTLTQDCNIVSSQSLPLQGGSGLEINNSNQGTPPNTSTSSMTPQTGDRDRDIACTWGDVTPILESFGIKRDAGKSLSVKDGMTLHNIHMNIDNLSHVDVVTAFLSRLMSYDYRSMRVFKNIKYTGKENTKASKVVEISRRSASRRRKPLLRLSCRDITYAIINVCDPFLKQEILFKMSACQLAVPILLPGTKKDDVSFLLWGLQKVEKAWQNPETSTLNEHTVVKFPFPVVAAIRFGQPGISKSNVLNKMLGPVQGNDDHPYFFSRDLDSKLSFLSVGTLEATWYLPDVVRNSKHSINKATCFLNLRGDAQDFEKQLQFSCLYSQVMIVFINLHDMKRMQSKIDELSQKCEIILVMKSGNTSMIGLVEDDDAKVVKNKGVYAFDASNLSTMEVSETLCTEVNEIISHSGKALQSLEETNQLCEELIISIDMRDAECCEAKKAVEVILGSCRNDPKEYKQRAHPLQIKWQKWSELDKDRSWKGSHGDIEKALEKLYRAKEHQRTQQREIGMSEVMCRLYEELQKTSATYKQFLLFWLHQSLNDISFTFLRPLGDELNAIRNQIRETAKKVTDFQKELGSFTVFHAEGREVAERELQQLKNTEARLQKNLFEKAKEFDTSSLGFEHFVREFGQIYESFHEYQLSDGCQTGSKFDVKRLPMMVAEMLLSGHPLEIFDGDACHVPVKWINGVMTAVRQLINDASVYVISVIGIQSSGKSTLLNSMFGVRFAVSAGRCTRGVFLQLLPVSGDLKNELGCDYVIVIDTEGLKAPEKAISERKSEDNELATFALCISDMTLINVGGQTVGEDLSNILQISAHAFIRMKEVHLKSSCYLIQQFVADITARYRNQSSTQSILQKLDQSVVTCAIEERKENQYRQFSDCFNIINTNSNDEGVQYVPSLWRGTMSAPNHEYSKTVLRLKSALLMEIKKQGRKQKISEFVNRTKSVWDAIKEEDFVFNFKNTNEISQYNNFSQIYKKQSLMLTKEMMKWELDAQQKIRNSTVTSIQSRRESLMKQLGQKLKSESERIREYIEDTLQDNDFDCVRSHATYFYRDFENVVNDIKENVRKTLHLESSVFNDTKTKDMQILPQLIADLRKHVLPVAEQVKQFLPQNCDKYSNVEITLKSEKHVNEAFEQEWSAQMEKISLNYPTETVEETRQTIETDINRCIMENIQNTGLSKDMKEIMNTNKLSELCEFTPAVHSPDDVTVDTQVTGPCSPEITKQINKLIDTVHSLASNKEFVFSVNFMQNIKDALIQIISIPCNGCREKIALLTCLCCQVVRIASDRNKDNTLNKIINDKSLLEKLNLSEISSVSEILEDVEGCAKKIKNLSHSKSRRVINLIGKFGRMMVPWQADESSEHFHNHLRKAFLGEISQRGERKWYSREATERFMTLLQTQLDESSNLDESNQEQVIRESCMMYIEEATRSEKDVLAETIPWIAMQTTLGIESIAIADQMKTFLTTLGEVIPPPVKNVLSNISEESIEKYSRLVLSERNRHILDMRVIDRAPMLTKSQFDTIFTLIHDFRNLFLGQIKSIGMCNTMLMRSLVTNMHQELDQHNELGKAEQALVIAYVCSWAFPICVNVQRTFIEKRSIRSLIHQEKERLFKDFKSLCEGACMEYLAARSMCLIIKDSLNESVMNRICSVLFQKLTKAGNEIFCSRPRFLQAVLQDLCEREIFDNYPQYLHNHNSYIQDWTMHFIANECCDTTEDHIRIQDIVMHEIGESICETSEALDITLRSMNQLSEEATSFEMWKTYFSENFEHTVKSSLNEERTSDLVLLEELPDYSVLTDNCKTILKTSMRDEILLSINPPNTDSIESVKAWLENLPKRLHVLLSHSVKGCGFQCPFCKTFCDDTVKEHKVHFSNLHFPKGVGGGHFKGSGRLDCSTCTADVASDAAYYHCGCGYDVDCGHPTTPYKEYKKHYPTWHIQPIADYEPTLYWKWVLAQFNRQFAEYYMFHKAKIPWSGVTKQEALKSIGKMTS